MEDYQGVRTAVCAEAGPGEIARPATRAQRRWRIPYLAARVASLEFELAILEPVPIGLVERRNQRQRLLILRFRHDYLRTLLAHAIRGHYFTLFVVAYLIRSPFYSTPIPFREGVGGKVARMYR